ncbi:D-arabinitol 2-dehydrogenase [ribulose-forming] [Kluyveromyces marxianus]|uniref:D-arabinitol 2-dehydrogenase [ribulose-forming] n=2 Tax=Kluyveromyces marxianus TaxID=4911 RepID=W0T444_KLUMD|nr:D-arabinitol 2-dehydrogenase [ribulose-forming] [Kluyveromyces marxianus DMKU3-1042]AQY75512.1 L-arabitol dehydrogenase [Kluyveromyces marxianus]AQY75514.1 L-arabitol dehydrogenase [Kluyveromyces marxianus]QGN13641.1 D-arabinitol 2-dehydrogenase [Kluyveromyces marxianus]BAO38180.1 D-arabinitol 2-dehydrogenase [ribulose-forming] [Kluyveromyces marxianus DMKU3-1042]BAP69747.1 D-arabinitol 2-dehydrogenase [ribulose-forming] [Kluyveromyces marxianus]
MSGLSQEVRSATPINPSIPSLADVVPSFRLDGHVTIITGAAGGLAHTLSQALVAQGSQLALMDLSHESLENTRRDLIHFQKQNNLPEVAISIWACDISNADEVEEVVRAIPGEHNGIIPQKLVHTAGFCQNINAHEYDAAKAQKLVNVNLLGSLYICQSMARQLLARRTRRKSISTDVNESGEVLPHFPEASFVLIGSMSGLIVNTPQPQCAYNMSKAGVIHLVKSLAAEWAKYGIRVNAISPGYIATALTKQVISQSPEGAALQKEWTNRIPVGRMAEPKEFVGSMLYLLSRSASSYTTGENMVVDGGYVCW